MPQLEYHSNTEKAGENIMQKDMPFPWIILRVFKAKKRYKNSVTYV